MIGAISLERFQRKSGRLIEAVWFKTLQDRKPAFVKRAGIVDDIMAG